ASCATRGGHGMKTLVLGGGVVGVTSAYFLARAGHEVTVLEEREGLGLEATAGNAGIIAPGHSFAWASPRAPRMLWQSMRGAETAIRVRLTADPQLYAWGLRFLRECTSARARHTRAPCAWQAVATALRGGLPLPAGAPRARPPPQHAHQAAPLPVQPGR